MGDQLFQVIIFFYSIKLKLAEVLGSACDNLFTLKISENG